MIQNTCGFHVFSLGSKPMYITNSAIFYWLSDYTGTRKNRYKPDKEDDGDQNPLESLQVWFISYYFTILLISIHDQI